MANNKIMNGSSSNIRKFLNIIKKDIPDIYAQSNDFLLESCFGDQSIQSFQKIKGGR